jgi:hypothetical protein
LGPGGVGKPGGKSKPSSNELGLPVELLGRFVRLDGRDFLVPPGPPFLGRLVLFLMPGRLVRIPFLGRLVLFLMPGRLVRVLSPGRLVRMLGGLLVRPIGGRPGPTGANVIKLFTSVIYGLSQ